MTETVARFSQAAITALASMALLSIVSGCSGSPGSPPPHVGTGGGDGTGGDNPGTGGDNAGTGGSSGGTLIDNPTGSLPQDLVDVGIYPDLSDLKTGHARAFYYEPTYPLWSNGLDKGRWIVLPEGTTIDTTEADAWNFPVGTLFFKTFGYVAENGQDLPVETRLIRRIAESGEVYEQWEFKVYEWNVEGTGAQLLDITMGRTPREATIGGNTFTHNIPQESDCWNCHIANKVPVIGFDEMRLNGTAEGKTENQLEQVIANGLLSGMPASPWAEITDSDDLQQRAFRYIHANCAHCHNGLERLEPGARYPEMDLRWDRIIENTVGVPTQIHTAMGDRIVAGNPEASVLFIAVSREAPDENILAEVQIMPLVGVDVVDAAGIDLLRQWITSLNP